GTMDDRRWTIVQICYRPSSILYRLLWQHIFKSLYNDPTRKVQSMISSEYKRERSGRPSSLRVFVLVALAVLFTCVFLSRPGPTRAHGSPAQGNTGTGRHIPNPVETAPATATLTNTRVATRTRTPTVTPGGATFTPTNTATPTPNCSQVWGIVL